MSSVEDEGEYFSNDEDLELQIQRELEMEMKKEEEKERLKNLQEKNKGGSTKMENINSGEEEIDLKEKKTVRIEESPVKMETKKEEIKIEQKKEESEESKEPEFEEEEEETKPNIEMFEEVEIDYDNLGLSVKRLQNKILDLKDDLFEEEELRKTAEKKLQNLEMRKEIKQIGSNNFEEQITQATEEIKKSLEKEYDTKLKIESENLNREFKKQMLLLKEEVNEAQRSSVRANDEKERLNREIKKLESENEELFEEKKEIENNMKELDKELKELRREQVEDNSTKKSVERNYTSLKIEYNLLNQKYKELLSKNNSNEHKLRELEFKYSEAKNESEDEKRNSLKATKECDRLHMQVNALSEQLQDEIEYRGVLDHEMQSLKLKVAELSTQLRIGKNTIDRLESAKNNSERELQKLRNELLDEKFKNESGSGSLQRSLEEKLKQLQIEFEEQMDKNSLLNKDKRDLRRENKRLSFKIESLEREKGKNLSRYERSKLVSESGQDESKVILFFFFHFFFHFFFFS